MPVSTPPAASAPTAVSRRPRSVTAIAIVAMVLGAMMLTGAALLVAFGTLQGPWGNFHEFQELSFWLPSDATLAIAGLALNGAVHVVAGVGLARRRVWGWGLALALVVAQVVSGIVQALAGAWDQVSQAVVYALGGAALLTPRVREWFGSPL